MDKVIKVTDDEIYIKKEDDSIVKTVRKDESFDAKVGDSTISQVEEKDKMNEVKKINKKAFDVLKLVKLLSVVFFGVFLISLIGLIVVVSSPKGRRYETSVSYEGETYSFSIEFKNGKAESRSYDPFEDEYIVNTTDYLIADGKLYGKEISYHYGKDGTVESTEESEGFVYAGEITSTKLVIGGVVLKEKTMSALKVSSITLMIVFGVLDLFALATIILSKKGLLKLEKNKIEN